MEVEAAKLIGAGLATIGVAGTWCWTRNCIWSIYCGYF